jgi:hypothetical protein
MTVATAAGQAFNIAIGAARVVAGDPLGRRQRWIKLNADVNAIQPLTSGSTAMSSAGALRAWSPSLPSHWLVMSVLFAGALGVGSVLLPGQVQRIAMLERDGQSEQALAMLEQGYRDGDRRMRPMLQLQTLYEQLGRLDQARTVLAELTERHPRDANVLKRALSFHRMTQDRPAYIRTLQTQIAVKYSEEACKELIGLLRLQSAAAEEQGAIQGCRQRGYRRAEDMIRLASLLASSGDFAQASAILRGVDDLRRLKTDKDRTQLTATLIEIDQPREAYRRAMRWLRGARDTPLALTIISLLAGGNKHDVAIELARDISVPGDAVSLAVAELMLDRGEPLAAKTYLSAGSRRRASTRRSWHRVSSSPASTPRTRMPPLPPPGASASAS